ncbi:hypothetical protein B9799_07115 [Salmonella enterica]|uniref:Uncharacterized protein n=1 Tax=Salmonella enterica TaxID=28901 RepID=A0A5U8F1L3_SALER|nr:hypothetical protein [Edwardsiella piscicida]EAZ3977965.1 hypothetical protein [Salmonella enterica]EDI4148628.1 hypothetical protein [Salmonella enterica subsp. enterica serovar Bareilly]EAZ4000520.1 hypothetical protein [Salmonella enterica]EAZ4004658.1 hypothetical protein [Salmonella enterica]EAZ4036242.1 hypothetical protein [Salmonella enterica]
MKLKNILFYSFVLIFNVIVFIFHDTGNDYLAVIFAAILSMNALIIPMGIVLVFDSILLRVGKRFKMGNDRL